MSTEYRATLEEYKCEFCCFKPPNYLALIKHLEGCHKSHNVFFCNFCDLLFLGKTRLNLHMISHMHFECPYCPYTTQLQSEYEEHTTYQHGIPKAFEHCCDFCPETFKTYDLLRQHVMIHRESWKFNCGVCSETFYAHAERETHLEKHDDRPLCVKEPISFSREIVVDQSPLRQSFDDERLNATLVIDNVGEDETDDKIVVQMSDTQEIYLESDQATRQAVQLGEDQEECHGIESKGDQVTIQLGEVKDERPEIEFESDQFNFQPVGDQEIQLESDQLGADDEEDRKIIVISGVSRSCHICKFVTKSLQDFVR